MAAKASAAFEQLFFDTERGCLFDVVDNERQPGAIDRKMRPNQIFAVGGCRTQFYGASARDLPWNRWKLTF